MTVLAYKKQCSIYKCSIYICTLAIIQLLLVALFSMPIDHLSAAAYDTVSTTSLTRIGNSSYNLPLQLNKRKQELLYVLDSNRNRAESQILLIDPQSENTLRSFRANMAPDIALSKDGSRLYIASKLEGASENGALDVVDTATGKLIASVDNPDHVISPFYIYNTHMALSHDGKWLYVFKHNREDDVYYIEIFDTVNNRFLPRKVPLDGYVSGDIASNPYNLQLIIIYNLQLIVTCNATRDIRHIDVTEVGSLAGVVKRSKPDKTMLPENRPSRKLEIDGCPAVILPLGSDTKFAIIMSNGDLFDFDRPNMRTTFSRNLDTVRNIDPMFNTWLYGRWIWPQPTHYNPSDKLIYIGTGKVSNSANGGPYLLDQVEAINSKTITYVRSILPPRPFCSLAVSADGMIIYTVSPDDATVTLTDSSTSAELKVIKNVGVSPIRAIVSR